MFAFSEDRQSAIHRMDLLLLVAYERFWELTTTAWTAGMGRIDDGPDVLLERGAVTELLTVRLPFSNGIVSRRRHLVWPHLRWGH